MKMMSFAVALLISVTARGDDLCQSEKSAWDRALERAKTARQQLESYDSSSLAPVVPGQAEKERQHLQDNLDAAWEDVKRTMNAHDKCVKRKTCKKWKAGWHCTIAGTWEECCLDPRKKP
jgi:hypothetical protein